MHDLGDHWQSFLSGHALVSATVNRCTLVKGWCAGRCKDCLDGVRPDAAVDEALGLLGELLEGSQEKVEVAGKGGEVGAGDSGGGWALATLQHYSFAEF